MRKNKQKRSGDVQLTLESIRIEDIAAEGKCIARHEGAVIFVEGAVAPGDIVDLQVLRKKKNFMEAVAIHIHEASPLRTEPFCEHFGICGGCKWQHITYETQLAYKYQQVIDNLERIAKVALPTISPILPSTQTQYYRNKLEFTFSPNGWLTSDEIQSGEAFERRALGFHIPRRFDKILDIKHCYLQAEPSNAIRLAVKQYALQNNLTFFNNVKFEGFLRNLIIRTTSTGELMVIVQVYYEDWEAAEKLLVHLRDTFPQITSLQYVVNGKGNDTFHDLNVITFHGKPYITEQMEGLQFRIGPKSFYQTNAVQAYELYKIARDYAAIQPNETVYDLYTGTGTIANFVAKQAKKVVGLEYVPMAIEDAKENSAVNGITNTVFFAGDIKNLLTEAFLQENGRPEVVITDPPRAGMDVAVTQMLLQAAPQRIVYISCNPATQARDLALLDEKYELKAVQPVDMFPHTYHVENVVLLTRRML
ncbi:MAG: 23S rRNA (uracil(1939)-C(5))-methyltransferase RlmD [Bacteroidota bacterium]